MMLRSHLEDLRRLKEYRTCRRDGEMEKAMKTVTFRFGDNCSERDFAATMSKIQAMPSVEIITSVKRDRDITEQTAMFTAFLFDDCDEAAVKQQITTMPGIVWITNVHGKS